jgi:hypothetical protein
MKAFIFLLSTFYCLLSVPAFAQPASGNEDSGCMVCHSAIKVEYQESIHARREMTCATCHGGDPKDLEMTAMSRSAGFKGKTTRQETVKLCASCHADQVKMRPYGMPTDQYAQYLTSRHGIQLAKGDTLVAVCTDCHLVHRILSPSDPRSSVARHNVPQTCARCHSDPDRMKPYGLPTNQYSLYAGSVHGKALLEEANESAPDCASCHGTHGAAPPGHSEVASVCGQCHPRTRDALAKSPHKHAPGRTDMPECVTCHDHHAISRPGLELFQTSCAKCHEEPSDAHKQGQEIKTLILSAQTELEDAQKEVAEAKQRGLNMEREESSLNDARTSLLEVLPVQHSLSLPDVEDFTDKAKSGADDVKLKIHEIFETQKFRRVVLVFLWIAILISAATLYLKRRQLIRRRLKMI